ncbi:MAG: hypothetical protein ABIP78_03385 [Pyrinomonadaceae bacterium]
MLTSIETTATMGAERQLVLDDDIPVQVSGRVRVIILFDDDFAEPDWMKSAAANSAFDFLTDEGEDIYSLEDGKPVIDEA